MDAFLLLVILASLVTVMELFVAFYLIKKQGMSAWRSLYTSLPVIIVVWIVAFAYG